MILILLCFESPATDRWIQFGGPWMDATCSYGTDGLPDTVLPPAKRPLMGVFSLLLLVFMVLVVLVLSVVQGIPPSTAAGLWFKALTPAVVAPFFFPWSWICGVWTTCASIVAMWRRMP